MSTEPPQYQLQQPLHPLELPEILYLLATTLQADTRTLSKCSRVSKTWHEAFNPQLWRSLSCSRLLPLGQLSRAAIDRNVHLVHQIRVGKIDPVRYGTLERCRNLRRLHLEDERVTEWDLMSSSMTTSAAAAAAATGTRMKKAKKVTMAFGSDGEARRHSFPETTIASASGLSSSSVLNAIGTASGPSSSGTTMAMEDDVTGQYYDGDDEDEDHCWGDQWVELFIALIKQNPSLQKVCIMMERFEPTAAFWESIEHATNARSRDGKSGGSGGRGQGGGGGKGGALKSLECVFTRFPDPQLVTSFLRALTGLESLVLQHCTFEGLFFPPNILHGRKYPTLQSLTLATNTGIDLQTQLEFIQCFPNLQSLSWSIIGSHQLPLPEFCTLLQLHCPHITSLVLSDRNLEPTDLVQILLAIPRLFRFLLRFDTVQSMFNDQGVMDAMRRHFGTLQDLEFGQVRSTIRCGTVLEFLRGCPMLESLIAYGKLDCSRQGMMHFFPEASLSSPSASSSVTIASMVVEAAQDSGAGGGEHKYGGRQEQPGEDDGEQQQENMAKDAPWVCLGLKTLHVVMAGDPQNVWLNRSLQHRLFHQLGRLSQLQQLSLGHCILWMYENGNSHHGLDFTLDAGLAKLSGLKKLEELNLEGIYQRMGERDVEWMLENWPRLRVIEGELHHRREERVKLDWLMENRGFKILNHSYRK
ncbi:hypothetical protein EC957_004533 [Mortierella hygrophila]|uniref:F-box domain-containing protein n=1 Tax=Mortierella hygrophila TaxID=979708 RepID=A0A9P6FE38_9FUNG|nr:hypothetical protein EC957_004533 [Mortierella hygrophila]